MRYRFCELRAASAAWETAAASSPERRRRKASCARTCEAMPEEGREGSPLRLRCARCLAGAGRTRSA